MLKADSNLPWWLVALTCAVTGAAAYFYVFVGNCTNDFRSLVVMSSMLLSIPVVLVGLLAAIVLPWLVRSLLPVETLSLWKQQLILGGFALFPVFLLVVLGSREMSPTRRFAKRVHSPVPNSVRNISVAGFDSFLARRWLFAFEVNAEDAERIAVGARLKAAPPFDLKADIERDIFLRTIPWPSNISTNTRFFVRESRNDQASSWTHFVFDASASRGWFLSG